MKTLKDNFKQVDKKRKRDDQSEDFPEDFDHAELARLAAQAAIRPVN